MKNDNISNTNRSFGADHTLHLADTRPRLSRLLEAEMAGPFEIKVARFVHFSGHNGEIPPQIQKSHVNLGALLLLPLWLIAHGMWRRALWLVAIVSMYAVALHLMPQILTVGLIALAVILVIPAINLDREAWRSGRYETINDLFAAQKIWTAWGVAVWLAIFAVVVIHYGNVGSALPNLPVHVVQINRLASAGYR